MLLPYYFTQWDMKRVVHKNPSFFKWKYFCSGVKTSRIWDNDIPVDTGRKLNVHKTFRRRPGRLLNILCTFNLGPVSTRFILKYVIDDNKGHWHLIFQVILSSFGQVRGKKCLDLIQNSAKSIKTAPWRSATTHKIFRECSLLVTQ